MNFLRDLVRMSEHCIDLHIIAQIIVLIIICTYCDTRQKSIINVHDI